MTLTTRILQPTDTDRAAVLDGVFFMHRDNWRPWWQCSDRPYPARGELDAMLSTPKRRFAVATSGLEVVGYWYTTDDGVLLAGFVKHNPEHEGYIGEFDDYVHETHVALKSALLASLPGGTVLSHIAYANEAMWYGLEVVEGLAQAPSPPWPAAPGPTPTTWPAYTGPPTPE